MVVQLMRLTPGSEVTAAALYLVIGILSENCVFKLNVIRKLSRLKLSLNLL